MTSGRGFQKSLLEWLFFRGFNSTKTLTVEFSNSDFQNGQMLEDIEESFQRTKNLPQNPITLTTKEVKIGDEKYSSVSGVLTKDSSSKHYYGRVHVAPNPVLAEGENLDANVYYEIYCKSCDKTKYTLANNKSSIDEIYWYILPQTVYSGKNICGIDSSLDVDYHDGNIINLLKVSDEKINVKISKAPYKNRVFYKPIYDYLLFDRIDAGVLKHKFDISFSRASHNWAGEGKLGNIVDTNVSEKSNMSLEW